MEGLCNHHLLLIKDMSKIRLITQAPKNLHKLNINVVHLVVGFNGLRASLRPKSQKRLDTVPPVPTEHDLSKQFFIKKN
jgi:hypothetical protein